jgi:PKD repeat protein
MKKLFILFISVALSLTGFSAKWIGITSQTKVPAGITLVSSTIDRSTVHISLGGFDLNPVRTPRGESFYVSVSKATPILRTGAPDLPKLSVSLVIPDLAGMDIRVVSSSYKDFSNIEIAPSKGIILRTTDPSTIPYSFGKEYQRNSNYPGIMAESRTPHIIRDLRGQTFLVYPFQYNPVTKTLRVYYDLTIEVFKATGRGINPLVRNNSELRLNREFSAMYNRHFLNMGTVTYTPVSDYGKLLVICYGNFMNDIKPFVDWKNSIGFHTKLVDVATIGSNYTAIKNYITGYYSTNPDLAFVLLVGDQAQVPTYEGSGLGGPSDNAYGYLAGNDHYSDVFIGRFSAETVAHVQTQVTRTLNYERNPQLLTDDWYTTVVGIASDQGPGDDNELDYEHVRNQQTQLLAYTYTANPELFDGSQGGNDASGSPSPAQVSTEVNAGTSLILYTGHGSGTSWGTSGFSNSDVNNLTNQNKLPFIWSVACVNGDFLTGTCFAEAWLRASQGGQPTGAIAFLGSTINQSWDPPMCGQDEMTDILAESYPGNIKRTFAGISINGCMKMNDEYGVAGEEMTDTWTVFGDPTLLVRTDLPENLTVTNDPALTVGAATLHVTCNVNGARASASLNDSLIATGLVANNMVDLVFPALTTPGDSVHLVVTAYNHIPYLTDIPVITPNSPYVLYTSSHVNDTTGNNNHEADYDEDVLLTLYMKNVGVLPTSNCTVNIRSADPYITLSDTTAPYGVIAASQTKSVPDGYAFHVSNLIPDQHAINFDVVSMDGSTTWNSSFSVTGHAPVLECGTVVVRDSTENNNGRLDPGETDWLKICVKNTGSAEAFNVAAHLVAINPYVTVIGDQNTYGDLDGGNSGWKYFQVHVDSAAPQGQTAPFLLEMTADNGITGSGNFNLIIGQVPVLIIDLDGNQSSGPVLRNAVQELGIMANYTLAVNLDSLNMYSSIFVCLGIYPNNVGLSSQQGEWLASYLDSGGRLYMEGGDTWDYDQQTVVHPMFHIVPVEDGSGDLGTLDGAPTTFTSGMSFTYSGENEYIDRINAGDAAFVIFSNQDPAYNAGVAYDAGGYKTIGTSFEFAGLDDAVYPSTKKHLMEEYLTFFGIQPPPLQANFVGFPTDVVPGGTVAFTDFSSGGVNSWNWSFPGGVPSTSTEQNPIVTYPNSGTYDVTLITGNGTTADTMQRTAYIHVDWPTGIRNQQGLQCSLYPNPTSGLIKLSLSSSINESIEISICNSLGTPVYTEDNVSVDGLLMKSIDLSTLPEGVYYARISGEGSAITKKIIIRK